MKKKHDIKTLILALAIPFIATLPASLIADSTASWYQVLNQPSFAPPGWVFGPVWTILYLLMGYASYELYRAKRSKKRDMALRLFVIQLVLNAIWTPLFFGSQMIGLALIDLLVLDIAVIALMYTAWRVSKRATWALAPYLAWILFASILNASIYALN